MRKRACSRTKGDAVSGRSIGGYFGDHAPDDDQLFAAYAGSLPTSEIYDIVAHAEPLGGRKP